MIEPLSWIVDWISKMDRFGKQWHVLEWNI